jgi:hypothetical protein
MTELNYLTVDCFLYDLVEGFGESEGKIQENCRRFWQRIYKNSLTDEQFAELQARGETLSNYIELLGKQRIEALKYPLDGYYYPVKLGDTYALQIDCSGKLNDADWQQLPQPEKLQEIKQIILEHSRNLPGELGENWLIWGQLPAAVSDSELEAAAKDCYHALQIVSQPNWKRDLKGQGNYRGATFFELTQPDITADGYNRHTHALIFLFSHDQTEEEIKKNIIPQLHPDLIRLFHYRNKILWVYEKSRQLKQTLKKTYATIQQIVDTLSTRSTESHLNLNQLQQDLTNALSISYYYQQYVGYLEEQRNTIEINLKNYNNCLQDIAERDANSQLDCFRNFSHLVEEQYLAQLKSDEQNLGSSSKYLITFIATIQGIIEIEKTKNERTLNNTIALASVGIGTAGIAATIVGDRAEEILKNWQFHQASPTVTFIFAFSFSLIVGLIFAGLTGLILSIKNQKKYSK